LAIGETVRAGAFIFFKEKKWHRHIVKNYQSDLNGEEEVPYFPAHKTHFFSRKM